MKLIAGLFLSLMVSMNAFACKCLPMTWENETTVSEKIFHGKVIAENDNRFDIEIVDTWKGEFANKVFQLIQGTTSCTNRTFVIGEEYLFYVKGNEVSNYSRTTEYHLTIDVELLNAKLKGIGSMKAIEADELTEFQQTILKNLFEKSGRAWPTDIENVKPRFAVEHTYVQKLNFFEAIRHSSGTLELKKMIKGKEVFYILWLGSDWKKAEKRLK